MSSSPEGKIPDPSSPSAWQDISEQQLDEALSRAETLANDLAREVSGPQSAETIEPSSAGQPLPSREADEEIKQLDELLAETKRQVGESEEGTEFPVNAAEQGSGESHEKAPATAPPISIPDFMSEFTKPESPAPTPSEMRQSIDDLREESGLAAASQVAVRSAPKIAEATRTTAETTPTSESLEEFLPLPTESHADRLRKSILAARVSPVASKVCSSGIRVLEAMDRPFVRVGPRIRAIIGWAGILALAGAIVVFLFARR